MTLTDLWQNLPPEARNLLLGLAGKGAEGLVKKAATALGIAWRGTPKERALRECLTAALAEFLACLDLPEDPEARKAWTGHLESLLTNDAVQEALARAVLHEGRPEAVDPAPFRRALDETTLPWREGQNLETAIRALTRAVEREAGAHPQLLPFLTAARLKRIADQLERGIPVEGVDALLATLERIAEGQAALFAYLARMGYSVRVEGSVDRSILITGNNNQVVLADGGRLARLFLALPDPDRALTEYRAHIRRSCEFLPLEGLALPEIHGRPLDPARLRIPLDRVYIKLRALPYRERPEELPPPEDPRAMARYIRERQQEYRRGKELFLWEEDIVPPEEAVEKHPQLVLLGAPGAGKSTFLRHLARAGAAGSEALPLLVPLSRADAAMAGGRSLLEAALDHLTAHKAGVEREALRAALEQEIAAKRVCWLWDGLDEVRLHRQEVVEELARLAADGHRMVVTSRPLGYEPIPGCGALYEVLPLLPEDAEAFVGRWFRALAQARGVSEEERGRWAGERAAWLRGQLAGQPGLQEVARNPLLLTFLAVLAGDEPRRDLPRTRKDLYALYVERLLTAWEARRRGGEERPLIPGVEDPGEARELLLWGFRRVALHLHRAYDEAPERATRPAVQEALAEALAQETDLGRFPARARGGAILDFWERAGLLDSYRLGGREWLAFRHLTFQEYGVAWALAETHRGDLEGLWAELEPHLLEDGWAEVIPLALALWGGDVTPLVERLLEANRNDFRQQRPLFLAATALAEGARAGAETRQAILESLTFLARTREWFKWGESASAWDALRALVRLNAADHLLALARDEGVKADVRREAAEALIRLGRADDLLALARDEQVDISVRSTAVANAGRLGRDEDLRDLAQNERVTPILRVKAAEALSQLNREEGVEILWALAQDEQMEFSARAEAIVALDRLDQPNYLLTLLKESIDIKLRAIVAWLLERRGWADLEIFRTLAEDKRLDANTRIGFAQALGQWGHLDEAVRICLSLGEDEQVEPHARRNAAKVLIGLGRTDEAVKLCLALAQDERVDANVRLWAIEILGRLGRAEDLLALARDESIAPAIRAAAKEELKKMGYPLE